jgi:hypothetical protein
MFYEYHNDFISSSEIRDSEMPEHAIILFSKLLSNGTVFLPYSKEVYLREERLI